MSVNWSIAPAAGYVQINALGTNRALDAEDQLFYEVTASAQRTPRITI